MTIPNYMDWMRNLKMTLRYENKEYVLKKPLVEIHELSATPEQLAAYNKHTDDDTKVACIMVATWHLSYKNSMRTTGHTKYA